MILENIIRKLKGSKFTHLGVATGHVLHDTTGRQPPTVDECRGTRCLAYGVDRYVHHGPHALCMLLTEAKEVHFSNRDQGR